MLVSLPPQSYQKHWWIYFFDSPFFGWLLGTEPSVFQDEVRYTASSPRPPDTLIESPEILFGFVSILLRRQGAPYRGGGRGRPLISGPGPLRKRIWASIELVNVPGRNPSKDRRSSLDQFLLAIREGEGMKPAIYPSHSHLDP